MLFRLGHDPFVGGHHEQHHIDPRCPRHHGPDEVLMPRHVHHAGNPALPQLERREVELDGNLAATLLGEPVHCPAGQCGNEG
jgi:hypothetical protein